jgi:hypothetical protein
MASCCQPRCEYCGMTPCVGDPCPQWDDDEFCDTCGERLLFQGQSLCGHCHREEFDGDDDEWEEDFWEDDR